MKFSIKDLLFSVTLVSLVLTFVIFSRTTNQRLEHLNNQFKNSQAAQSFAIHAFLVQEKFIEGGATFSVNKLDFGNHSVRDGIILEIAYALPEEIPPGRIAGTLADWLSPLTRYCGTLNPNQEFRWTTNVQPELTRPSGDSLRSGIIRVEMYMK